MAAVHRVSRWPVPRGPVLGLADLLGGGQVAVVAAHDAGEDRFGGGLLVGLVAGWGGGAGDDVGGVGLAAAGHADVQGLPGQGVGDQEVGGVDGAALGDVDVAGVGELGAGREVGPGDAERPGPGAVQALPPDFGVGAAEGGDLEGVAVGEGAAVGVDVGVEAGADQVADPGVVAVGQGGLRGPDGAELGELGLDAAGQVGGFGVGSGEQQHVLAAQVVRQPHRGGPVISSLVVGAADAAVPVVGGDRGRVAVAEADAGLPFPGRVEPADLVQLGGGDLAGEQAEHAAGFDGAELGGIAGGDDPGSGLPGRFADQGQVRRG